MPHAALQRNAEHNKTHYVHADRQENELSMSKEQLWVLRRISGEFEEL